VDKKVREGTVEVEGGEGVGIDVKRVLRKRGRKNEREGDGVRVGKGGEKGRRGSEIER